MAPTARCREAAAALDLREQGVEEPIALQVSMEGRWSAEPAGDNRLCVRSGVRDGVEHHGVAEMVCGMARHEGAVQNERFRR